MSGICEEGQLHVAPAAWCDSCYSVFKAHAVDFSLFLTCSAPVTPSLPLALHLPPPSLQVHSAVCRGVPLHPGHCPCLHLGQDEGRCLQAGTRLPAAAAQEGGQHRSLGCAGGSAGEQRREATCSCRWRSRACSLPSQLAGLHKGGGLHGGRRWFRYSAAGAMAAGEPQRRM